MSYSLMVKNWDDTEISFSDLVQKQATSGFLAFFCVYFCLFVFPPNVD